ncbi:unnamed protein product [Linum trigynum]|uniref:Uncharacterized protein n=1 Tax=Linum trigynum TaxID=586398 RepID=A0AAV2DG20_9ROSI
MPLLQQTNGVRYLHRLPHLPFIAATLAGVPLVDEQQVPPSLFAPPQTLQYRDHTSCSSDHSALLDGLEGRTRCIEITQERLLDHFGLDVPAQDQSDKEE